LRGGFGCQVRDDCENPTCPLDNSMHYRAIIVSISDRTFETNLTIQPHSLIHV